MALYGVLGTLWDGAGNDLLSPRYYCYGCRRRHANQTTRRMEPLARANDMKWLFDLLFRRREEPAPEPNDEQWTVIATPWASRVHELQELGLSGVALTRAVQQIETAVAETDRRVKAEMNLSAAKKADSKPGSAPSVRPLSTPTRREQRRDK